jgi:hypothetical protein
MLTAGQTAYALTTHSLDLALYLWPVSAAILLAALLAIAIRPPFRDEAFRKAVPWILATYAFPVAVVAAGTVLRYDGPPPPNWVEMPHWRGAVVWGVVIAHGLAAVALAVFRRGVRLRSFALALPGVWLSASVGFMAILAIYAVSL